MVKEVKFSYKIKDGKQRRAIDVKVFAIDNRIDAGIHILSGIREYFVAPGLAEKVREVLIAEQIEFKEEVL